MNIGTQTNSVGKTNAVRDLGLTAQGVSLRSVSKKYDSFVAVENLNLDIPVGDYYCLLGPSGCGKTTLRMIAGHEDVPVGMSS